MKPRTRSGFYSKFMDSYWHYRTKVGLGRVHSVYRAFYYEIKGKEPWGK